MSVKPILTGEDVVPVPEPLTERPPADRFCDLVLTGGIASGVVYPWAILELARSFRFKNIGGTSVGAMAAALAAAAEYGRRNGHDEGFEVLRQLPGRLAREVTDGGVKKTRMASLFQPEPRARRLFELFFKAVQLYGQPSLNFEQDKKVGAKDVETGSPCRALRLFCSAVFAYWRWVLLCAVPVPAVSVVLLLWAGPADWKLNLSLGLVGLVGGLVSVFVGGLIGLVLGVLNDLRKGLVDNDLGLCRGFTNSGDEDELPGLIQWLHRGVQRAAGLDPKVDRPLTFGDLWNAPRWPGDGPRPRVVVDDDQCSRAINLEMITTNVTLGRPFRLPLKDQTTRLFFRVDEWSRFFPPIVMKALVDGSDPYVPKSTLSPFAVPQPMPQVRCTRWVDPLRKFWGLFWRAVKTPTAIEPEYRELPGAGLPIVVATRLSLSFPLLFSAVPLYAIDFKSKDKDALPGDADSLRRCWFSDGGLSSNFPIHLFDAALPRWPTFGIWLGKFNPRYRSQPVWLPKWGVEGQQGGGDSWQRFDPEDPWSREYSGEPDPGKLGFLARFLVTAAISAKDWQDRSGMRMPHVRGRVARLALRPGEGELNIAMSRRTILLMADRYGVEAGRQFTERFVADGDHLAAQAWTRHRKVRLLLLVKGLRELLSGLSEAADYTSHTMSIGAAIQEVAAPADIRASDEMPLVFSAEEG